MAFLILFPVVSLMLKSFKLATLKIEEPFTLRNYIYLFTSPRLLRSFYNTIFTSSFATLVAAFLALSLAWINARTNTPLVNLLEPLNIIPFFLSPYVGAIAWTYLASPKVGLLNHFLMDTFHLAEPPLNVYSLWGIAWVQALFFMPIMYLFVIGALRRIDPALEESARISGSGQLGTMCRITLPLTTPGILSGLIFIFVSSAGEFGVPLALGSPFFIETLSTEIFSFVQEFPANYNMGASVASSLMLITISLIYLQRRIILPRQYTTITGKGYRPHVLDLGRFKYITLSFNLAYILVAVILPIATLFIVSIHRYWNGKINLDILTLENYRHTLTSQIARLGLSNSFKLALVGATLCMIIAFVSSYAIYRGRLRGRGALDFLSTMPVGVPGIVMAMGILLAYIRTPLYGTLWIILVGYISRFIPYGQRSVTTALLSLSAELEESSRTCGASWIHTMRRITIPLLKPGIFAGWIMLFVIFLREFPISVLLYKGGTEVLSVAIYYFYENEPIAATATLCMIQVLILLGVFVIFRRLARIGDIT